MTTRNEAQKICSHRPWKMRRKTTMLPIAPSKPITAYNMATTSPPMNWLLDPAPVRRFCSKAESILVDAPTQCPAPQRRLCASTLRFHRLEWLHLDPLLGLRQRRLGPDDDRLGHTPPGDGLRVQGGDLAAFGMRRVDRDHVQFGRAVNHQKAVDRGEVHAHAAYRTIETGDVEAVVGHRLVRLQSQAHRARAHRHPAAMLRTLLARFEKQ